MSPLVPEPAPVGGGALAQPVGPKPIESLRDLMVLLQQVRVTDLPTLAHSGDESNAFYVAPSFAAQLADTLWPALLETVKRVRAEDRDPARHGLPLRELRWVRADAAVRAINTGGADVKTLETIKRSFTHHPPKADQPERYEWLRREAKELALLIMDFCPASRERSLAITKLEEFVMWANKAIAVNE